MERSKLLIVKGMNPFNVAGSGMRMRPPGFSLLLSLFVHLGIAFVFVKFTDRFLSFAQPEAFEVILLDRETADSIPAFPANGQRTSPRRLEKGPAPAENPEDRETEETEAAPVDRLQIRPDRYAFLHAGTEKTSETGVSDSLKSSILRSISSFRRPAENPAEQWLRERTGEPRTLFGLNALVPGRSKIVKKSAKLDFIPTETQIQALSRLYEQGAARDTELYPHLDTETFGTYDMYRNQMERLVEKGVVSREKISPEQMFILFVAPIEMNAKNRKNPEYRYEPLIPKQDIVDFLNARLYALNLSLTPAGSDTTRIHNQIRELSKKIGMLLNPNVQNQP